LGIVRMCTSLHYSSLKEPAAPDKYSNHLAFPY